MRYAAKKDLNQDAIVAELLAFGCSVRKTHQLGGGFPDLVVGWRGRTLLVEVKQPGKEDDLTADEREFFAAWRGAAIVASDAEQVIAAFERMER